MTNKKEREALAERFDHHVEEEGRILSEYRQIAEQLGDGALGFVLDLILTEEEMHHLLLRTITGWLRDPGSAKAAVSISQKDGTALLDHTRNLKKHEKQTIEECGSLKATLTGDDAELLGSLLDVLVLDSKKHHLLLSVVENLVPSR